MLEFKIAKKEDVEGIIKLCNECFFEETEVEYAYQVFEKTKNNPNDIYLIGTIDGKIVAHAKITIIETMYKPMMTYSILNHVCVKPEYRRCNIATKMLKEIEKICVEKGCVKMELWSNNVRVPAHACYKKYGFHLDDAGFFSKEI
jgi:ribosomal protein S18 acetylase RimI-like enzyme